MLLMGVGVTVMSIGALLDNVNGKESLDGIVVFGAHLRNTGLIFNIVRWLLVIQINIVF